MKLDKLTKKLSRDIGANPKKAAVLGLMVLVAIYFWFPLLKDWFSDGAAGQRTAKSQVILTDDPEDPTQVARKPKETLKWEKVRQWLESDRLMAPAVFNPVWHDPFVLAGQSTAEQAAEAEAEAAMAASTPAPLNDIDPRTIGMNVVSVVIGPRQSVAVIGGEMYRVNDSVPANVGDGLKIEFKVVAIEPTKVELERDGKRYELPIGRPKLASGDRIIRAGGVSP